MAKKSITKQHPIIPSREQAVAVYSEIMAAHECKTVGEMAESELGEPTPSDEELELLADCHMITDGQTGAVSLEHLDYARAALARWGNHPAKPDTSLQPIPVSERLPGPLVDSEVAELVEWLDDHAYALDEHGARIVRRAVDLLKQLPPRPISVSERPWERKEWCDEQGRCWWLDSADSCWVFDDPETCPHWASFVLPAHALPLPTHE